MRNGKSLQLSGEWTVFPMQWKQPFIFRELRPTASGTFPWVERN